MNAIGSTPESIDMNAILKEVRQIFPEKGALCDSEGFYQHYAECWSDAIQMMFLFSDGLKEVVQEKLLMEPIDDDEFVKPITDYIRKHNYEYGNNIEKEKYINKETYRTKEYFIAVRNRLARHYLAEYERRIGDQNTNQQILKSGCPINKSRKYRFKYHTKGKEAIRAAFFGKDEVNINSEEEWPKYENKAGTDIDIINLIAKYITMFFEGKVGSDPISYHNLKPLKDHLNAISMFLMTKDHGMCFYTCGNQDFFYEDNTGPIQFPWRRFLSDFTEVKNKFPEANISFVGRLFQKIDANSQVYLFYPLYYYSDGDNLIITSYYKETKYDHKVLKNTDEKTITINIINDRENNEEVILEIPTSIEIIEENNLISIRVVHFFEKNNTKKNIKNKEFTYKPALRANSLESELNTILLTKDYDTIKYLFKDKTPEEIMNIINNTKLFDYAVAVENDELIRFILEKNVFSIKKMDLFYTLMKVVQHSRNLNLYAAIIESSQGIDLDFKAIMPYAIKVRHLKLILAVLGKDIYPDDTQIEEIMDILKEVREINNEDERKTADEIEKILDKKREKINEKQYNNKKEGGKQKKTRKAYHSKRGKTRRHK